MKRRRRSFLRAHFNVVVQFGREVGDHSTKPSEISLSNATLHGFHWKPSHRLYTTDEGWYSRTWEWLGIEVSYTKRSPAWYASIDNTIAVRDALDELLGPGPFVEETNR